MSNNFQNQDQNKNQAPNQNQEKDQNQNRQAPSFNESNPRKEDPTDRIGNNIEKDEPRAEGGMKKEATEQNQCPASSNKSSQDNRPQDSRRTANS